MAPLKPVAGAIDVELRCKSRESDNGRCYLLQPWEVPGSSKPNAGGGREELVDLMIEEGKERPTTHTSDVET